MDTDRIPAWSDDRHDRTARLAALLFLGTLIFGAGIPLRGEIIFWPLPGLDVLKQQAGSIGCLNNLHQIGSAARIWSFDHGGQFPGQFQVFTNELDSPARFYCPADVGRLR